MLLEHLEQHASMIFLVDTLGGTRNFLVLELEARHEDQPR